MMMRNETLSSYPSPWTSARAGGTRSRRATTWSAEVVVRLESGGEGMLFDALRISPNGMFLQSALLFESGERLHVTFPTPDGDAIEAVAEVTELEFGDVEASSAGMELVFVELDAADRELLELAAASR